MNDFYKTFEFKGHPLAEMSEGRRSLMMSILAEDEIPKIPRIHYAIYALICDTATCKIGFRNLSKYIDLAQAWADKNVTQADYEAEALLLKQISEHANATAVETVENPDLLGDPSPTGN